MKGRITWLTLAHGAMVLGLVGVRPAEARRLKAELVTSNVSRPV